MLHSMQPALFPKLYISNYSIQQKQIFPSSPNPGCNTHEPPPFFWSYVISIKRDSRSSTGDDEDETSLCGRGNVSSLSDAPLRQGCIANAFLAGVCACTNAEWYWLVWREFSIVPSVIGFSGRKSGMFKRMCVLCYSGDERGGEIGSVAFDMSRTITICCSKLVKWENEYKHKS